PAFRHSEDFDLWLRIAHGGGRLGYQTRTLAEHRYHGGSLSAESGALLRGQLGVCRKLLDELELDAGRRALLERHCVWAQAQLDLLDGKRALLARQYHDAARLLRNAARVLPGSKV